MEGKRRRSGTPKGGEARRGAKEAHGSEQRQTARWSTQEERVKCAAIIATGGLHTDSDVRVAATLREMGVHRTHNWVKGVRKRMAEGKGVVDDDAYLARNNPCKHDHAELLGKMKAKADIGRMTYAEYAQAAGCSVSTARRVMQESSGHDFKG